MNVRKSLFHCKQVHTKSYVVTVVTERTSFPSGVFIVGNDHTALAAGREVLGLAEREAAYIADGTGFMFNTVFVGVNAAEALRAVFDDFEVMFLCDSHDLLHIAHNAVKVNNNDTLGSRGDKSLDKVGVDRVIVRYVAEYGDSARLNDRERRRDERVRGNDNFIAGADVESRDCDVKSSGSVSAGNRIVRSAPFCPLFFKFHTLFTGPVRNLTAFKGLGNLIESLGVELRPHRESEINDAGSVHCAVGFFSHSKYLLSDILDFYILSDSDCTIVLQKSQAIASPRIIKNEKC